MSKSALDAGIPVLTEVIKVAAEPAAKTTPVRAAELRQQPEVVDVPTIDGWLNEEWNRLERKIGGRILHQVMERLEADIEDRVRDVLADVLQVAVETLANDIKQNLQGTLREVISQAVKAEISRMQTAKK
ncbi:MAG TPA: hypothetical protein VK832_20650 [Burkholderiaceae bacterium]|jgi:hypothetical protein|nr:hypothetical protein [Burkholderiaceae bacterium]